MDLFPIMVRLESRKCIVVGAGEIAAAKTTTLLGCGAQVTVIAPRRHGIHPGAGARRKIDVALPRICSRRPRWRVPGDCRHEFPGGQRRSFSRRPRTRSAVQRGGRSRALRFFLSRGRAPGSACRSPFPPADTAPPWRTGCASNWNSSLVRSTKRGSRKSGAGGAKSWLATCRTRAVASCWSRLQAAKRMRILFAAARLPRSRPAPPPPAAELAAQRHSHSMKPGFTSAIAFTISSTRPP